MHASDEDAIHNNLNEMIDQNRDNNAKNTCHRNSDRKAECEDKNSKI